MKQTGGKELIQTLTSGNALRASAEPGCYFRSLAIGDRHEAHADGSVLVGPDDDLALTLGENLPSERLRPEPGQPRRS